MENNSDIKKFIELNHDTINEFMKAKKTGVNDYLDIKNDGIKDFIDLKKEDIRDFIRTQKEHANDNAELNREKEQVKKYLRTCKISIKEAINLRKTEVKKFSEANKQEIKEYIGTIKFNVTDFLESKKDAVQDFINHYSSRGDLKDFIYTSKEDIKDYIDSAKEDIKDFISNRKNDIKEFIEITKDEIQECIDEGKEDINEFITSIKEQQIIAGSPVFTSTEAEPHHFPESAENRSVRYYKEREERQVARESNGLRQQAKAAPYVAPVAAPYIPPVVLKAEIPTVVAPETQPVVGDDELAEFFKANKESIQAFLEKKQNGQKQNGNPVNGSNAIAPESATSPATAPSPTVNADKIPGQLNGSHDPKPVLFATQTTGFHVASRQHMNGAAPIKYAKEEGNIKRVLLAEDDLLLRKSLAYYLSDNGFTIVQCSNGAEAMEEIKKLRFDLLVIDLKMPVIGGMELIQMVRTDFQLDTPIIVLTASGIENVELESFGMGANEFIAKPFSPTVLKTRIDKLINARASAKYQN